MTRPKEALVADAARRGDIHEVRMLLLDGHDPNVAQEDGMTALHWAFFHEAPDILEALAEAGADGSAQDGSGNTPLDYGAGAAVPSAEAMEEVTMAAWDGLPIAQASIGRMYLAAKGRQDMHLGISWYLKSAKAGYAHAQYVVGVAHAGGEGAPEDRERAFYWLELAASRGHKGARKIFDEAGKELR